MFMVLGRIFPEDFEDGIPKVGLRCCRPRVVVARGLKGVELFESAAQLAERPINLSN